MKAFDEKWEQREIDEWLDTYNVLVLFETQWVVRDAKIIIHGKMDTTNKLRLASDVAKYFGGISLTYPVAAKVNEYAQKWYNKHILKKKARVLNSKGKKK